MKSKAPFPTILLSDLQTIIEQGKRHAVKQVNSTLILVYWKVGKRINEDILNHERAAYGKEIISSLANSLETQFGNSFKEKNIRRMVQFAELFSNYENVVTLSRQLSWSHILVLIPMKDENKRDYYIQKIAEENWSVRQTRYQIERKAYERSEIAASQLMEEETKLLFKDPYLLDFLNLKDGFQENDLEAAILKDLELFILELGMGFTFVERQKRMIIDGDDFYLDLLFYHRKLHRLIAIELKIGKFKAADKGQMELYLKWLNKYDKQEGEHPPIGLILCAEASKEQIELLEMDKDGIMVAEYWTDLPPKAELEKRLHQAVIDARERIIRNTLQS